MMRQLALLMLIGAIGLLCLQCTKSTEPDITSPPAQHRTPADLTAVEKEIIESSNRFGFNLFREVANGEDPDSNIFISPLSASFALGMVYNGVALETRDEMAAVLGFTGLTELEVNESYRDLTDILINLDPTVNFEIANGIWYRLGKPVNQSYIDLCRNYFSAMVEEVDFQDPAVPDMINGWVSDKTHGHIDTIITPPISPDLAMLLANAIYFKASWTHLFDSTETEDKPFMLPDGSTTQCRMMYRDDTLRYFENDLFRAADLPYGDEAFSMTVLVPVWGKTPDDIIAEMSPDTWALWMAGFSDCEMKLGLPKFRFEYETGLNDMLKAMGMPRAFEPGAAQFYAMFDDSIGWIDTVFQKTFVQVDESGTEAVAVTGIIIFDSASAGMIVDRPFVFVIHERESGTIIFMGKIVNPIWLD